MGENKARRRRQCSAIITAGVRKRVARLAANGDEQRGGGPNTLSLYQHDMSAVETARVWEARRCLIVRSALSLCKCFEW